MSAAKTISTFLMGDGSLLIRCGDVLRERGHEICAVVTASEQCASWARQCNIPIFSPREDLEARVDHLAYDWFFSIGNLRIVPERIWLRASEGTANFHDGPLPRHAGLYAPAWAIIAGETTYGVTWHRISAGIDEGDILAQAHFDLEAEETSITINTKCFEAGLASFTELVALIERGAVVGQRQDLTQRIYHERLKRPAHCATLDFETSAESLRRLSRALTFGVGYVNPLATPKVWAGDRAISVVGVEFDTRPPSVMPGEVVAVSEDAVTVACAEGAIRLTGLSDGTGLAVSPASEFRVGQRLPGLPEFASQSIAATACDIARNEKYFETRLRRFSNLDLPMLSDADSNGECGWQTVELPLPKAATPYIVAAGLLAGLARLCDRDEFSILHSDDRLAALAACMPGFVTDAVPVEIKIVSGDTLLELASRYAETISDVASRVGMAADIVVRYPKLTYPAAAIALRTTESDGPVAPVHGSSITFALSQGATHCRAMFDAARISASDARHLIDRLSIAVAAAVTGFSGVAASIPVMSSDEEKELLQSRNDTACEYERDVTIHEQFEQRARLTPDAMAIVCGDESLTYRQLDEKADRVARRLIALGVGPDTLVGLHLPRSCDLVVGALAILKAGGAYVPLDPGYPAERLALMVEDSGLEILIADRTDPVIGRSLALTVVTIADAMADPGKGALVARTKGDNLAYVIYTSGSTGRPKGVMIEHCNVVNFFRGMDERIPRPAEGQQPVWLAVTSLSFDISVLELFWTLTRGFKVVINRDARGTSDVSGGRAVTAAASSMEFGLFYWGDDDTASTDKYRLLLEGARIADENGFNAVWTPERHFHAFGGPYPNAAVTGAAVAATTKRVSVRAGSCVLPLHHPARVVEEWAVVDNISQGRAAVAFASGWMPEDFLLRPENAPPNNKSAMLRDIEVVRALWRGDKVAFETPSGKPVEITTQPRPVQRELPVWLTTAGNPDTFREAGLRGYNLLTHLLGQSIEEVGKNILIYREALAKSGRNPSDFTVTLMLHTLVGRDREVVRSQARLPMSRYLRSAAALIKEYAWAFPAFKKPAGVERPAEIDLQTLDAHELDAIIEFAFERYFEQSGLFGSVEDAIARVNQVAAIGVDEVACLIDFGVPGDVALAGLVPLSEVVAAVNKARKNRSIAPDDASIGALIKAHGVTHFQCTPAMATAVLSSEDDRAALSGLRHMFVGGEALQAGLIKDLRSATGATIENMYGPTETTIWSSTGSVKGLETTAPLGRPIANTQLYLLDSKLRPIPRGMPGELLIGGDGVARGYHNRPDLTSERFLQNPFVAGGRIYRTGDIVRIGNDDELHFLGRSDHQVKVRGYRIELGEIETCLGLHPGVSQAVVLAREDIKGDVRIVAYLRFKAGQVPTEELKEHARHMLPDFMLPAHFVSVQEFPLTPNAKIDRKALPRPDESAATAPTVEYAAPQSDIGMKITDVFKQVLGVERVGLNDNFFDLGGHSLLAVQAHRSIKAGIAPHMSITDIYRFPRVGELVAHLTEKDAPNARLGGAAARAARRRNAMNSRRGVSGE